jgi:hypothetical protein
MRSRALAAACLLVLSCLLLDLRHCKAQPWTFDQHAYASLVDADSPQTIPPGTRIGARNWQRYRNFLPIGVQALFSGSYQFRIPDGPHAEMVVGPTIPILAPFKYQRDTEQYAGKVKLVHRSGGHIDITGYVAGLPFPDLRPSDPDLAYKLMYNAYFHYHPAVLFQHQRGLAFDTYLNRTDTSGTVVEFRLNHISDESYPLSDPLAPSDILFTSNFTVQTPEQNKYAVNLLIYYNDPNTIQDIYVYIPALRRSIRRSSAARCSQILGTDIVQDDVYSRPIILKEFSYRVLGRKKLLFQAHLNTKHLFDESSYNFDGVPGWPKPILGPWELRIVWVVEERTLPSNKDYCYGSRVTYWDEAQFLNPGADLYDRSLRLQKLFNVGNAPGPIDDGHGSVCEQSNGRSLWVDLINSHATATIQSAPGLANGQVPENYRDVQVWALPAGLSQMSQ